MRAGCWGSRRDNPGYGGAAHDWSMGMPYKLGRLWFNAWGPSYDADDDLLGVRLHLTDKLVGTRTTTHMWRLDASLTVLRVNLTFGAGIMPKVVR